MIVLLVIISDDVLSVLVFVVEHVVVDVVIGRCVRDGVACHRHNMLRTLLIGSPLDLVLRMTHCVVDDDCNKQAQALVNPGEMTALFVENVEPHGARDLQSGFAAALQGLDFKGAEG